MNLYKKLAGQTLVYGMGTIVPRVLNYLLTPFYTWIFIESQYGVITEIYSYIAFLMVLLTYGMETTFFRFTSQEENKTKVFNNAFSSLLITSLIFFSIIYWFKLPIANKLGYKNFENYIVWFSLIVVLDALTAIPFAKLRLQNRALKFSLIKIGNILVNIGFNIFFFAICRTSNNEFLSSIYNPEIGVGYAFLSNLFASLFNLIVLLPDFKDFKFRINWELYKRMLSYALPLLIVGLAGMVNEVADKVLLKYLTPEKLDPLKQVGIYGANYKLAVLMTIFIQMFKYAAEPFFFSQAKNTDSKIIYSRVMNYFVIFCLIIFLIVTLYLDVFKYFMGKPYWVGLKVVPIILLANMFLGIYYNLSIWYKLTNRTKYGALIALIGVIITLVINLIFIPIYGYMASAWATFLCYFIMMIISYYLGKKYFNVKYNISKNVIYIFIALGIYFIKQCINFNYILNISISTVLFCIFLMILIKVERLKLTMILNLVRRK